jgi:16S rRNA U516 pseudouridylate synthase RsuA-like enzyme
LDAHAYICSRRHCDGILSDGNVTVTSKARLFQRAGGTATAANNITGCWLMLLAQCSRIIYLLII